MSSQVTQAAAADQPVEKARGSSFYLAMRMLPAAQREAMYAVYAFCRAVDDVADEPGPIDERNAELAAWRADIEAVYRGETTHRTSQLLGPIRRFGLKQDDFLAVIDGMAMDLDADIRAPDFKTLDLYCDRVASAVGRLSVRIFGMGEADGVSLAHHLGRALQLTNILRDIDEDAGIGRLYLPREALAKAGISSTNPLIVVADPRVASVCHGLIGTVETHYRRADEIMRRSPRATVKAPRLMFEAYRGILAKLVERGFAPPRAPVRLEKSRLIWLVLRHGLL